MIIFSILAVLSAAAFFVAYNFMCTCFRDKQQTLAAEHQKLVDQASRLEDERKALARKLAKLEQKRIFASHDVAPAAPLATKLDVEVQEVTRDERMANHMLTQGMITLEQHDKVLQRLPHLKMDFASACLTLGYIDDPGAKTVIDQFKQ